MGLPSWPFFAMFGALQLGLSMLPDFGDLSVVSLLGALMSIGYCTIAAVMCFTSKPGADVSYDPSHGRSTADMVFGVFNALTTVLFAYGESDTVTF